MKKILPLLILIIIILLSLTGTRASAFSPYTTWAIGPGGWLFMTQDAYTPLDEIDLPLAAPEDMFLAADGFLYVADTGNSRIVKLDKNFQVQQELGSGILQAPTGLFVDESGVLYIADSGQNTIIILDKDGNLIKEFGRPSEPLFGKDREFLPRKITVDARKNLYIVSEGSVNGLVMMNTDGNFIGYFGSNAAEMSLKMILQRMFLTQEQLDQFVKNEAASPSNVVIDSQSLVYTVTAGTDRDKSIRKFTVSGRNLFDWVFGSTTFRDAQVSADGLLVTVDSEGLIFEYDLNGTLLFVFGAKDAGEQRLGTLANPAAIERAGEDLYILDKDKNAIVTYRSTAFARKVHEGVRLYMDGYYLEAKPYFEEVLTYNGLFTMAYQGIADAYYKQGDYPRALEAYHLAEDRNGYSETFWELRNTVLQKYLGSALLTFFGLWVLLGLLARAEKRYGFLEPLWIRMRALQKFSLVDDLIFMFRFIKQPADSFYYIKKNLRGSLTFAFIVYVWVIIVRLLSLYLTGFVFSPYSSPAQIWVETEIVKAVLPLLLWNAANYLIATIQDGEGRLRDVIIGSAYSLFPYALLALPVAILSNALTLNEVFLHTFSVQLIWLWMGLMLFIMVKEIHNYSLSETIKNILTTIFAMTIFMLTGYILYVLFNQLYEFIFAIIREVGLRG